MTAIARLTRAELRKLATTRTFLITLALSAGLAVISVVVDAWGAGKNGTPPLGTTASTYQMLKFGAVTSVGRGAVLAGTPRVDDDAEHGEAGRQGEGDQEGPGGCELAQLGAGETGDGSHDGQASRVRSSARSLTRSKNSSSSLSVCRVSSRT